MSPVAPQRHPLSRIAIACPEPGSVLNALQPPARTPDLSVLFRFFSPSLPLTVIPKGHGLAREHCGLWAPHCPLPLHCLGRC